MLLMPAFLIYEIAQFWWSSKRVGSASGGGQCLDDPELAPCLSSGARCRKRAAIPIASSWAARSLPRGDRGRAIGAHRTTFARRRARPVLERLRPVCLTQTGRTKCRRRMPRVFHIAMVAACPFPYARGTPIRILRMAEALAQIGHEVHVVTYHLGAGPASAALRIHRTPSWPATGISGLDRPWQALRAGSVAGRQTGRRAAAIPDRYCSCPSLRGPPGRGRSRRRLRARPSRRAHPGGL